jgi:hypothetical protein
LGIYKPAEKAQEEEGCKKIEARQAGQVVMGEVVGKPVPAVNMDHGLRASIDGEEIDPKSAGRYLQQKFTPGLDAARAALEELA